MRRFYISTAMIIGTLTFFSSCAKKSESDAASTQPAPAPTPTPDGTNQIKESVTDASITNTLAIATGDGAGTELEMPPNAVPVGTQVEMRVADAAPTAFAAVGDAASTAIYMNTTDASGANVKPAVAMTVALVIGGSALTGVDKIEGNLCAMLQNTSGEHFVWRREALEITNGKARFKTKEMGTFQLVYCGATVLSDFVEVGATGDTKEVAAGVLEGAWKSGCIVSQDSSMQFTALGDGVNVKITLVGLYGLEAKTYVIGDDFPQVVFDISSTANQMPPVTFTAASGSFTVDTTDAAGTSGSFNEVSSFVGYSGSDISIDFTNLTASGGNGGTMAFAQGGGINDYTLNGQSLLNPALKFEGAAVTRTLTFAKGELTHVIKQFADSECKKPSVAETRVSSFAVGAAATVDTKAVTKLDLTVKKVARTLLGAEAVARANAAPTLCGLAAWTIDVEQEVTGNSVCLTPAKGSVIHQFFGIVGKTLKLGEDKADGVLPEHYDDEFEFMK